ncbi:hypothetical protein MJO29_010732 [Puccinia striiformis f. sp. tritici]|uniref:SH3 domain-containing protein n=1 Tax=Puccinia striiformis f. sp. tritici PST-78 TaxID=1165861 RepID=A0A0L0VL09_9BASI|nr:hypothetical protein Pst134EA_020697 [Puccinia striiformis f. sp. tritici]KAH9456786.1 hypothetical protein Pst134EA_020697 [Puccinia striiformis f. sp. tritici]KAI7946205.1 hypothetical protein MJO29_010732 [Puccinia striiformis f. sp. tritici]KNE99694.1 hypothetical protein PSTG_06985 [Puccinia striiformis f. sp. tritici PST-78]
MAQHNAQNPESIYTAHLITQIHANLDVLLQQAKISRNNVDIIKDALPQIPGRADSSLPEPSFPSGRAPSLPRTTPITQTGHPQPASHHPPSPLPAPSAPPAHQPLQQFKQARALWAYRGSAADDLSFEKGDIVVILAEENPDWWRGQVLNGQQPGGLFPSNHVEIISVPAQLNRISTPQYQHQQPIAPYPSGPPQGHPGYQFPAYSQAPQYGDYKTHQAAPPPPLQHTQSAPPANITVEKPKKNLLQGRFGQALAGGAGFGAGSAVATHVVNAIL